MGLGERYPQMLGQAHFLPSQLLLDTTTPPTTTEHHRIRCFTLFFPTPQSALPTPSRGQADPPPSSVEHRRTLEPWRPWPTKKWGARFSIRVCSGCFDDSQDSLQSHT